MLPYIGVGLTIANIILMAIIDPIFVIIPILVFVLLHYKILPILRINDYNDNDNDNKSDNIDDVDDINDVNDIGIEELYEHIRESNDEYDHNYQEKEEDDVIELSVAELVGLDPNDLIENDDNNKKKTTYGLSLAYHRLTVLPYHIATDPLTTSITSLDLTDCKIKHLESLKNFTALNCLILDHNNIEDINSCPLIQTLETLWCNNNHISKLGTFLNNCVDKFPRLKHLSIMRNPGVPDIPIILEEYDQEESQIIGPGTKILDDDDVKNERKLYDVIADDKADKKSDKKVDKKYDYKSEKETDDDNINDKDNSSNNKNSEDYLLYRPAVLSILKNLLSLDGIYFTNDEMIMSSSSKVASWIATDDLDETEIWKWPSGYKPSIKLLRDKKKMKMIRHVQSILDLRPACRDKARTTFWELDKRTVLRYLEASLWKEDLNGTPVYQAIIDTINWRQREGIPFGERDKVWLREGLGKGFIIIPCAYDSFCHSLRSDKDVKISSLDNDDNINGDDNINNNISNNNDDNNSNVDVNDNTNNNDDDDDIGNSNVNINDNTSNNDDDIGIELDCFLDTDDKQVPTINPSSRCRSKDGKPIIYMLFANDRCKDGTIKGKTLIYSFERAIQLLPKTQTSFILVIDMTGFGFNSAPAMKDLKEIGACLSKHMCCRLAKVFIVNVSFVTKMIYDSISSLFSEVTRSKFVFISEKGEILQKLRDHIDIDNIPIEYGGNNNDMFRFNFEDYINCDPFLNPNEEQCKFFYS